MPKSLYNATVIPEIIKMISVKYGLSENDAATAFYKSETAKALNDTETGLYGKGVLFIFSLCVEEVSGT